MKTHDGLAPWIIAQDTVDLILVSWFGPGYGESDQPILRIVARVDESPLVLSAFLVAENNQPAIPRGKRLVGYRTGQHLQDGPFQCFPSVTFDGRRVSMYTPTRTTPEMKPANPSVAIRRKELGSCSIGGPAGIVAPFTLASTGLSLVFSLGISFMDSRSVHPGLGDPVDQRGHRIHQQDGVHHAFWHASEKSDQHHQTTDPDAEKPAPERRDRG